MSRVSVVITCHNYGRFLGAAIESARGQTGVDVEVIVVDDGSSDNTAAVAARYLDVRYVHQSRQGVAEACNRGLALASGELVVFLDADDELTPRALETSVAILRARPECAFVYGHVQFIDKEGAPLAEGTRRARRFQTCIEEDPYRYMLRLNTPLRSTGAILYRAEVVRSVGGFAREAGGAHDLDLNFRIARAYPICCNDRVVLRVRRHGGNMSLRFGQMLRDAVVAQRRQRPYVDRDQAYLHDYRAGLRIARSYWGRHLADQILRELREGHVRSALLDLGTLGRHAPQTAPSLLVAALKRAMAPRARMRWAPHGPQ